MKPSTNLDCAKELIPILWELTEQEKKCTFNISTDCDNIYVSIYFKKKDFHFKSPDKDNLMKDIKLFVNDCVDYKNYEPYYEYLRYKTSLDAYCN